VALCFASLRAPHDRFVIHPRLPRRSSSPLSLCRFLKIQKTTRLVAGLAEFDNLILCQITSKTYASKRAVLIEDSDFTSGGLDLNSYVRPDKIFIIEKPVIEKKVGSLEKSKLKLVRSEIRAIFN